MSNIYASKSDRAEVEALRTIRDGLDRCLDELDKARNRFPQTKAGSFNRFAHDDLSAIYVLLENRRDLIARQISLARRGER